MKGGGGQPEKPDQTLADDPKVFNISAKHWKWFIQDGKDYSLICPPSKPSVPKRQFKSGQHEVLHF